ncbi:cytochrome c oxidase assembly protein [Bacillus fonticola]|uniref:cytochrome c oxidase assembly protein n=1 Tax=Bacillus fonticola TaxID=2728853 RepID=UPI001D14656A|nr:cytochrome c oxidase assembly protein [Bacillus fonticola]
MLNPLLLLLLIAGYFYYWRWVNKGPKIVDGKRTWKYKLYFGLGLLTIYVSLAGPVAILADNLILSAHMLQQSLMYIVMPPLILLGIPGDRVKKIAHKLLTYKFFDKVLTSPLITLFLFNVLWSFYHIPVIYEYLLVNTVLLEVIHVVVTTSAFLMWIQVVPPVEELSKLSELKRMAYMFANGILITPACALIIFAPGILYPSLLEAPTIIEILPPIEDQRTGGIIMKVVQEFSYGVVIAYIFFKWAKKNRELEEQDLITPDIKIS